MNSLKNQKTLYKVLTPSIKPPWKSLLAYGYLCDCLSTIRQTNQKVLSVHFGLSTCTSTHAGIEVTNDQDSIYPVPVASSNTSVLIQLTYSAQRLPIRIYMGFYYSQEMPFGPMDLVPKSL